VLFCVLVGVSLFWIFGVLADLYAHAQSVLAVSVSAEERIAHEAFPSSVSFGDNSANYLPEKEPAVKMLPGHRRFDGFALADVLHAATDLPKAPADTGELRCTSGGTLIADIGPLAQEQVLSLPTENDAVKPNASMDCVLSGTEPVWVSVWR
jgi:hypothetical protein